MGLNPGSSPRAEQFRQAVLAERFNGGSPYNDMFKAGFSGVPLEDCVAKCYRNGIAVRPKDIKAWEDGMYKRGEGSVDAKVPSEFKRITGYDQEQASLNMLPMIPQCWEGPKKRFFPCTDTNKPIGRWGWTAEYTPELFLLPDARAISPCGWVGQNILYQRFIVVDIDGRGHGSDDIQTIEFGNLFKNSTFSTEDPAKPGSFHLYFKTDRLIRTMHFMWAKIDFMGNAVNSAVYMKNKIPNNIPMMELTEEIWQMIMNYQRSRKGN